MTTSILAAQRVLKKIGWINSFLGENGAWMSKSKNIYKGLNIHSNRVRLAIELTKQ